MVIALTAITIIFLNEKNIRPKINLVRDAEKIKAFGQALLNQGNRLSVTMSPAK